MTTLVTNFRAGRTMLAAGIAIVALAAACGGNAEGGDGDGGGSDATVDVVDARFVPDDITIKVGDTVTWNFEGRLTHSVVGDFGAGEVASPEFTGSGTFEHTFTTPGTFEYACGIHTSRMLGEIIVE